MSNASEIIEALEKALEPRLAALDRRLDDLEADLIRLRQEGQERESDRRWISRRLRALADTIECLPVFKAEAMGKSSQERG